MLKCYHAHGPTYASLNPYYYFINIILVISTNTYLITFSISLRYNNLCLILLIYNIYFFLFRHQIIHILP